MVLLDVVHAGEEGLLRFFALGMVDSLKRVDSRRQIACTLSFLMFIHPNIPRWLGRSAAVKMCWIKWCCLCLVAT